jgi:hypothetical protein
MERFFHQPPRVQKVVETTKKFLDDNGIKEINNFPTRSDLLTIPPSFSLRSSMTPARNQGGAGTCTSFGCVSCLEYFHHLDTSEGCTTDETERAMGDCREGLAIGQVMQVLKDRGTVDELTWPYDETQICWTNPPNTAGKPRYRFSEIGVVFHRTTAAVIDNMRLALTRQRGTPIPGNFVPLTKNVLVNGRRPVVLDVPVWWKSSGHFDAGWEDGPDIRMPSPVNLQLFIEEYERLLAKGTDSPKTPPFVDGWHAIAICGYDDRTARLEFKNSWNTFWGDMGFGTIPYDYITQYSRLGMHGAA